MTSLAATLERERLLELALEYRNKGYEVLFQPSPEDLPDFLSNYRPNMIARRGDEAVVVEVKSRSSLSTSDQYLRYLAQAVEQHPGWRFELVIANSGNSVFLAKAERTLQEDEIKSRLNLAKQLQPYPEPAILYSWSLVEATLRLVAEKEHLALKELNPYYLLNKLAIEGVISTGEHQLLRNALYLRNAIAHGFKTNEITQNFIGELIQITEQLLQDLHNELEQPINSSFS